MTMGQPESVSIQLRRAGTFGMDRGIACRNFKTTHTCPEPDQPDSVYQECYSWNLTKRNSILQLLNRVRLIRILLPISVVAESGCYDLVRGK